MTEQADYWARKIRAGEYHQHIEQADDVELNHEMNMRRLGMYRPDDHRPELAQLCPGCGQDSVATMTLPTSVNERPVTKTLCSQCGWAPGRSQVGGGLPRRGSTVPLHNHYVSGATAHYEPGF